MKRHAISALCVLTLAAGILFAQAQLFGPPAPNNTFFAGTGADATVRPLIGLDTSDQVEIDPDAVGASFAGALTVDGNATITGTSTLTGAATITVAPTLSASTMTFGGAVHTAAPAALTLGDFAVSYNQGPTVADGVSSIFFIADRAYTVTDIDAVWRVAESTGAMNIQVQRLQGTEDIGAGDDLLSAVIDATGTANTVANGTLTGTTANLDLTAGDRLAVELTATPDEVTDIVVTVGLAVN